MGDTDSRRAFLTAAGAAAVFVACRNETEIASSKPSTAASGTQSSQNNPGRDKSGAPVDKKDEKEDEEVSATEDLMREHGAIRRILVVYRESAMRLRAKPKTIPPDALERAAKLIRTFAEDYHERQLEETHIFPAVRRAGGAAAGEIDLLLAQHQRGREVTDYVLALTRTTIGAAAVLPLAHALETFARMYEEHAAREDTILFPAWKKTMSAKALDEMGELFEDIEHKTFGRDGFDDAVQQVAAIERALGLDPAAFMAPPPPTI